MGSFRRRRHQGPFEVTRPVRCRPTRTTPRTDLEWAVEMAQFHAKPREHRERVNEEPTAVTGVVIALVGTRVRLDPAVDANRVADDSSTLKL